MSGMATVWPFSLFFERAVRCCTIFPSGNRWEAKFLSHLTPPKSKKKMASSEKQSCGASFGNFVSHEGDNGQTLWFGGRTSGAWGEYQYTYHPPPGFAFLVSLFDLRSGSMCINIQKVTCVNAISCLQCCHSVAPLHPFVLAASASAPTAYASMHAMVNSVING